MLDIEDYASAWQHMLAWGIYLIAAGLLCLAFMQLTRRWQKDIRLLLLALIAVFLLVPAPVPGRTLLAPAMIFVVLSPVTGTPEVLAAVVVRLMLASIGAIILVILAGIWRRWRQRVR